MKRLLLATILVVAFCFPVMAQFNVAPGGAIMPDGGLQYVAPVGAPFQANPFVWNAYPFTWPTTPVYWVSYPYVPVPSVPMPWHSPR